MRVLVRERVRRSLYQSLYFVQYRDVIKSLPPLCHCGTTGAYRATVGRGIG